MKYIFAILISAVVSYLLGSCNSSIITIRLMKGEDIRKFGSGNAGLTNTLRCFGKLPALITLIGDLSKGVIAVFICKFACTFLDAGIGVENDVRYIGYIAGLFAVIGHIFPVYYGFKGGKGVLVGVSVFLVVDLAVFGILILIFAVVLIFTRYVSVSSMTAALLCPFVTFFMRNYAEKVSFNISLVHTLLTIPICAIVIFMHRSNIQRLKNGTENRFSFKKKEE